jgi:hypothetical protein
LIRKSNPLGEVAIPGIFINPRPPARTKNASRKKKAKKTKSRGKQKGAEPMARDRKGRFLPGSRPPRRKKRRKKRNPVAYAGEPAARRYNPRKKYKRKKRPRRKNPVSYAGAPGRYKPSSNPRRVSNPNGAPVTLKSMIAPTIAAVSGFLAPGIAWYAIGEKGRAKTIGWFEKGENAEAKARFTVSAITTAVLYLLSSRIAMLKKYRRPLMIGAVLRTAKDGADALLSTKPGTTGLKLRMIFSLPPTTTITPSKAALEGTAGATGQKAGFWVDPASGTYRYGPQGLTASQMGMTDAQMQQAAAAQGTQPGGDMSMQAGGDMDMQNGGDMSMQAGGDMDMLGDSQGGIFGVDGIGESVPLTTDQGDGMGEIYVNRQLAPSRPQFSQGMGEIYVDRQLKATGYQGIGTYFVDKNLVYLEKGQRYPAIIGSLS